MEKEKKTELLQMAASAVLLLLAVFLPVEEALSMLIYFAAYIVVGAEIIEKAVKNIFNGKVFGESFLMVIATIGAILLGEWFEAVMVMLLFRLGEFFEDSAVDKSRDNIIKLMDIRPDTARVVNGGAEKIVSPKEVEVGDIILVLPGEKIPLDGVVAEGSSTVDTSAMTGESVPAEVSTGMSVIGGTVNLTGTLKIRVEKSYGEGTVAKILDMVENSSAQKARPERFIRRFAKYYTPAVVIAAALLILIPSLITGEWILWIRRALTFLVISCPCALVISVPLTFFMGVGCAARNGILVKGASYLEAISEAGIAAFDKTGTLTDGEFSVTEIKPIGVSETELLNIAAAAEKMSAHPIAIAIVRAADGEIGNADFVTEHTGMGVEARIGDNIIFAGKATLMEKAGCAAKVSEASGTAVHVAKNGEYLGYIILADRAKKGAAEAIQSLRASGIKQTVMLTGDRREAAEAIGKELSVNTVFAELLPGDKAQKIAEIKQNGKLIYAGDGINDAPALALADIGVAMGGRGFDAAMEAADVVLMDDDIGKLSTAIKISRKTKAVAAQNIVFSLAVKGAFLLLGALGLVSMGGAVFADVGVMVLATLSALRAAKIK